MVLVGPDRGDARGPAAADRPADGGLPRACNLFVASFIGSPAMNFLDVEAGADGRRARLQWSPGRSSPAARGGARRRAWGAVRAGRKAVLGIRPTDLAVGGGREVGLAGEVFLVEPIGPVTYVDVDLGGRALKAICDPDPAPAVGERVTLGFQARPRAPVRAGERRPAVCRGAACDQARGPAGGRGEIAAGGHERWERPACRGLKARQ